MLDKLIEDLKNGKKVKIKGTPLDVLPENNPTNNDTIGELIYKLSCVTMQMWENQEALYRIRKMTTDDFINKYSQNMPELHITIKRCCDLNFQRATLVDAIDATRAK